MIDENKLIEELKEYESLQEGIVAEVIETMIEAVEEQPKVGEWIPAEHPQKNNDYVLLSFENYSIPLIGRYEQDEKGDGAYYVGDCDEEYSCLSVDLYVNSWMPLPEPYREGQEDKKRTNADWIRNMTDEELSFFLNETVYENGENLFLCDDYDVAGICRGHSCDECKGYLHWLKQELEEQK